MQKERLEKNPMPELTFNFSLPIIEFCQISDGRKFITGRQLLRSAASTGANCMETQNAQSKADFIHKIKIAAKEAEEMQYWLLLCDFAKDYPGSKPRLQKLEEIHKIINKILSTAKRKSPLSFYSVFL